MKESVSGTVAVLEACGQARIQRVVHVSSHQAVAPAGDKIHADWKLFEWKKLINETDWNNESSFHFLSSLYAKTASETALWRFVSEQKEKKKEHNEDMKVAVVTPGVAGPAFLWGRALPISDNDC